jgi:phosphoribosylformylglycinamidine synthase
MKKQNSFRQFLQREDTLSVGICNGCQLFMELEVINPEHDTEKCTTKVTNTKVFYISNWYRKTIQ